MDSIQGLLAIEALREELWAAWTESLPGATEGHEEGGFIVLNADGITTIVRWPKGEGNRILVPPHERCRVNGCPILASFHTHPNTGPEYLQEPSESDICGVSMDEDLKAADYLGEVVISAERIYLVRPDGLVHELGQTGDALGWQASR